MTDDRNIIMKVEHVSKTFKLPHEKQTSLKGTLINMARGGGSSYEEQLVLNGVSFEVKKGEFYGIVGRNGSGKSTLLKLLAGIYAPTKGSIEVNGKLTPFIELGVGFSPELTGRDNVFLNGALLGFNRKEMDAMYDGIVEFAELGKFMDQKLKNYSSGMQVRLAFSISIRARSDILLIDEVLAVGDIAFQQKCIDYFEQLKRDGQTVVLVSHDMGTVEKHCTRALLIHEGNVIMEGDPKEVAAQYRLLNLNKTKRDEISGPAMLADHVIIDKVTINGKKSITVDGGQEITLAVQFRPKKTHKFIVSMSTIRSDGQHISYYDTRDNVEQMQGKPGDHCEVVWQFDASQFLAGVYDVDIDIREENDIYLTTKKSAVQFSISGGDPAKAGTMNIQTDMSFIRS